MNYIGKLQESLNTVSSEADKIIDIKYSIFRMMQIYKTIPDIDEEGAELLKDWNEIKLEGVSFNYKDSPVLEDFNLSIKKGEKIGIVGKSGCGKSTLFKLMLKLYLPDKGMIFIDNKLITSIKRDSLLNKISIVPQETEVFNMTLRDNVAISSLGKVNYFKYKKAIKISQLLEVISKLKNKDNSLIGEKGVRLSGGEKQRLGIARAVYKDSEIIIFDEATSNLDYSTEKKLQEELNNLTGKTIIISAHRLSTLKKMDKILFMEKGRIIEQGDYDELIKKKGKFYDLWRKQQWSRKI